MTEVPARRRQPSGEQFQIAWGDAQAQVSQVGATLRAFTVDGRDVIDGFPADERCTDGRGQVLAPWPNRLTDGRYTYGGRDCQAPLNEPARHDAIHGLVRWLDWSPLRHDSNQVTLSCAVRPQPGYEWQLDLEINYLLDRSGLTVTFTAVNTDDESAPFGVGFHPYLTLGRAVDALELTVPGTAILDPDEPAERATMIPVAGTPRDFTQARRILSQELDTAFGDLAHDLDGRATARLFDPDSGRSVELWVDGGYRYLMVYTADLVGQGERRRAAIAIEPMTCPPDALHSGVDLLDLAPGESWRGSWGLRTSASP
ncbi:aldose 1-epimerase family protein [Leifsonia sp. YAF41]|uniref:aldose 1-epimerase family protein n=1 Tax=Leifsonia sp. YAF41 TaxID=3233086 RepID=UPI003F986771